MNMQKIDGYKTYLAALGLAIAGIVEIIGSFTGDGDAGAGVQQLLMAAGMAGLRHGVEKTSD